MKLTNNRYEVTFTAKGGEIKSFTDLETGIQYMWRDIRIIGQGKKSKVCFLW